MGQQLQMTHLKHVPHQTENSAAGTRINCQQSCQKVPHLQGSHSVHQAIHHQIYSHNCHLTKDNMTGSPHSHLQMRHQ